MYVQCSTRVISSTRENGTSQEKTTSTCYENGQKSSNPQPASQRMAMTSSPHTLSQTQLQSSYTAMVSSVPFRSSRNVRNAEPLQVAGDGRRPSEVHARVSSSSIGCCLEPKIATSILDGLTRLDFFLCHEMTTRASRQTPRFLRLSGADLHARRPFKLPPMLEGWRGFGFWGSNHQCLEQRKLKLLEGDRKRDCHTIPSRLSDYSFIHFTFF
jgi:hypothetical protein